MARPFSAEGDRVRVMLSSDEREFLDKVLGQQRGLLRSETPASDPALVRLFPPAHPDDPLQNLEYERVAGAELLEGRLEAIGVMRSTLESDTLEEPSFMAWLEALNSLRLVLGTRLDVTEDTTEEDFDEEGARERFDLYRYLTWLQAELLDVLPAPGP